MDANEYTDGVWAGQNPGSGSFSGESYSQWKFYDDTNLGQSGCNEKECSSGEGNFFIFIGYHIKDFKIMRIAMILKVINLCNIYSVDGYKDNCELEIELREELTTASSEPCTHNSQRVNG